MERKTNTPRCDTSMANHRKKIMGADFMCNHIGEVKESDCWHCGCFIVRHDKYDIHLPIDNKEVCRQARIDTFNLQRQVNGDA